MFETCVELKLKPPSQLVVDNGGETDIYMKKYTDRRVHEEILKEVHRQIQYRQI